MNEGVSILGPPYLGSSLLFIVADDTTYTHEDADRS